MFIFFRCLLIVLALTINGLALSKSIYYGSQLCQASHLYTCYHVKRGDSWQNLFKNPDDKDLVMRINRTNQPIRSGMVIAVPANLNQTNLMDYSPFPQQISAPGEKIIMVSLKTQAWAAYNPDGSQLRWGPASGGRGYCPDIHRRCRTSTGNFAIYRTQGAHCVSTKFPINRGGAPMPYCMFFNGGFALHGSYDLPGYNASHGCVRLLVADAKWLNQDFLDGDLNVPVVVSNE